MADEKSEQGSKSSDPAADMRADATGDPKPKPGAASLNKSSNRFVVPLALALGAGAIVYTLVTPNRGLEGASAPRAADCSALLARLEHALARYELASARKAVADAPADCRTSAAWQGSEAELLVLEGQVAQGKQLAARALQAQPKLLSARRTQCQALLQAAESELSRQCFEKLLPEAVDDLASVFHAARAGQHANKYRAAREGYLKALRLEPKHVEARYQLALMTQLIGATSEAANHLRKLEQIARPDDPRLAHVRQLLGRSAKPGAAPPLTPQLRSAVPAPSR